jgi:hypothetical protein
VVKTREAKMVAGGIPSRKIADKIVHQLTRAFGQTKMADDFHMLLKYAELERTNCATTFAEPLCHPLRCYKGLQNRVRRRIDVFAKTDKCNRQHLSSHLSWRPAAMCQLLFE